MIIPRRNDVIKHKNFMDVAILIEKTYYVPGNYLKIKGQWINQGFVESHPIDLKAKIKIKEENIKDWLIAIEQDLKCYRYAEWKSLRGGELNE